MTNQEFDETMVRLVGRKTWRCAKEGSEAQSWCGDFVPSLVRGAYSDRSVIYFGNAANVGQSEEVVRVMGDEDMRRMRRGYMAVRRDFQRRLNAYRKSFGSTKIRTWTYWTQA